jgi:hypothetical protein
VEILYIEFIEEALSMSNIVINVVKDANGKTVEYTNTKYNHKVTIDEHNRTKYFCASCGLSVDKMEFVSETGYYDRTVTMRCKCGKHVVYGG